MCLVLAWNTGFAYRYLAPILSNQSFAALELQTLSSFNRVCVQIISIIALAIALYFDFVLDLDIVGCLRALHDTRLDPKKIAKLLVDSQSSILIAQSASKKH